MTDNPYAPPRANLDSSQIQTDPSPALWNPDAAACWSLLFTSVFGALLHMKNWNALGEPALAASARRWAIASVAFYLLFIFSPLFVPTFDRQLLLQVMNAGAFVLLVAWYLASARAQAKFVKDRFGTAYRRRGWAKPLLGGVLAFGAWMATTAYFRVIISALTSGSWFRVVPSSGT